ncbi:hypothetical protein C1H46_002512 [Malus baccata]|uniref:Uncharacterized protein n=1 Tax=Malus baccata TaxID=106549 RepID=A0A540NLI8_MALBA|nr:hypothetical protein C1H46_002512 [Malus baccata]
MPNQMINPSFLCTSPSSQFLILAVSMRSALLKSEKNPLIDHKSKKKNKQAETTYSFPSWEWFAYQCTPTQFHSVVVPRAVSESGCRIQVIGVFSKQFLCAKLVERPDQPYASLYTYSCSDNSLHDVPKMNREDRNLLGAACALLDGCFYVAGGYKVNPSNIDPSSYLNSAERLNLKTWKWQALQNMQNPRAFASGFTHKGRFFRGRWQQSTQLKSTTPAPTVRCFSSHSCPRRQKGSP